MPDLQIKKLSAADAETLLIFSKKTFYDFFGPLNTEANMDAYASVAFTDQKILSELTNPDSAFYFAMIGDEIAGYLKLNFKDAQTELREANAMEVERIYVSVDHFRKGVGQQLMDFALALATEKQMRYVWLGVWEHNANALGFYHHNGFEVFSSHPFLLGDDLQTDLLMKKVLFMD